MRKSKFLIEEMRHHDEEAKFYARRNEHDYIWEVPVELFLFKKEYFFKGVRVIDFGCGPAVLIKHVLPKKILESVNYIGVDISLEMLKIAKRNVPNGKFMRDDMETARFKANSADIVISLGALHHSQNQLKTVDNWLKILKPGGKLLLREPIYEALHRGQGESPNEEGVKMNELVVYLKAKNVKVRTLVFFTSPFFHLFNKTLIKLGFGNWQKQKSIWYPVVMFDVYLDILLGRFISFFHGLSFAMEIIKL